MDRSRTKTGVDPQEPLTAAPAAIHNVDLGTAAARSSCANNGHSGVFDAVTWRDEIVSMNESRAPAGWFPDPSRAHELRYFDGTVWTDHVSDEGAVSEEPLGPTPPGLIAWFPPQVMTHGTATNAALVVVAPDVSRASTMRVLSIVVAVLFWFPIGIFCGIAGARRSNRARDAAAAGDQITSARLLRQVWMLLIVAAMATLVFGVAYTSFMVTRGY